MRLQLFNQPLDAYVVIRILIRGGLNAADFVKLVSVQRVSRRGLAAIGKTITTLARAEGLHAHAHSIEVRTDD